MARTAHILSNIGTAIITEGDQYFTVRLQSPDKIVPLTGYELSQFIHSRSVYKEVTYSNTEELTRILQREYEKWEALDNALELMDPSLSEEYRKGVMALLKEAILANFKLYDFIEARLFTTILPKGFSPEQAINLTEGSGAEILVQLYKRLDEKTDLWSKFYTLFSLSLNLEKEELDHLINVLTEEQIMHKFPLALYQNNDSAYYKAADQCAEVLQRMGVKYDPPMFITIEEKLKEVYNFEFKEEILNYVIGQAYEREKDMMEEELKRIGWNFLSDKAAALLKDRDIIHVLYTTENPIHIAMLKGELESKYQIIPAYSYNKALEVLQKKEIHIIVSDSSLKDITGIQLLSQLSKDFPEPIRILFTGLHQMNDVIDAINTGVIYKFLSLPYSRSELITTLASAHDVYRLKKENKKLSDALQKANEQLKQLIAKKQTH